MTLDRGPGLSSAQGAPAPVPHTLSCSQQQARQQGVAVPDLNRDGIDDRLQDPAYLARVTSQVHQQQPGLLGGLLGGAGRTAPGSDPLGNILSWPTRSGRRRSRGSRPSP